MENSDQSAKMCEMICFRWAPVLEGTLSQVKRQLWLTAFKIAKLRAAFKTAKHLRTFCLRALLLLSAARMFSKPEQNGRYSVLLNAAQNTCERSPLSRLLLAPVIRCRKPSQNVRDSFAFMNAVQVYNCFVFLSCSCIKVDQSVQSIVDANPFPF